MPKSKGRNGFYFFMLDWKKRQEAAGRNFPNGLKDVQCDKECSAEWQSLTPQQKGPYISMGKDSKVSAQGFIEKKTTYGESIKLIQELERKKQEFELTMHEYIDSIISVGNRHNNLHKLRFVLIHANWFFIREYNHNEFDYFPAEFAVAVFSLENGIQKVYHEIINAKIPLGFMGEARETSSQTHKIPIEMAEGQNDFSLMYKKLTEFLEEEKTSENKFPPLFTLKGNTTNAARCLLNRMAWSVDNPTDTFLVYSLESLFCSLRNAAAKSANENMSIHLVNAEHEFAKDVFCYTQDIECDFHKCIDSAAQYCSMSLVKRWGFIICDHCCEFLDLEMIPGVHCPAKSQPKEAQSIDSSFSRLSITAASKYNSMTGVTEEYVQRRSERSYWEEQRRRNECKPIQIIDYGKLNEISNNTVTVETPAYERPLRAPKTQSYAMIGAENSRPDLSEASFPPIGGRGMFLKKKAAKSKLPLGRGHGSS